MTKRVSNFLRLGVLVLGCAASPALVQAQFYNTIGNGDLQVGFRKAGAHVATNDLVVNIGNVTNLIALPIGTTITNTNVTVAVLNDSFSSDYTFLQWSVFTANFQISSAWATPLGNFPQNTLWYTRPRTNSSVQSVTPSRFTSGQQSSVGTVMSSIGNGARTVSMGLGTTNVDNNINLVREPSQQAYAGVRLSDFIADTAIPDPTLGDMGNNLPFTVENTTPSPFSAPSRCDLYEAAPAPSGRPVVSFTDPITGSTTSVYYVGYFEFSPAGVLTFTRAAVSAALPPAPTLTITRTNTTSTISFDTTSGATYGLIYTNIAGLMAPQTNWFTLGSPITGTGGNTNFTDTTSDSNRVYGVTAH